MLEVGAMTAASSLARRGRVRGPLNADDVGAPVRELPDTGRAGPRDRQVDDADVVQRKLRGHVLLRPCPSGGRPTPIIAAITPGSSRGGGPPRCRYAHRSVSTPRYRRIAEHGCPRTPYLPADRGSLTWRSTRWSRCREMSSGRPPPSCVGKGSSGTRSGLRPSNSKSR